MNRALALALALPLAATFAGEPVLQEKALPEIKGSILVPEGWFVQQEKEDGVIVYRISRDQPVNAVALTAYLILQALRGWVLWTLGARWTTRIMVIPGETLVSAGPYRYLSHPNYAVVTGEIAVLPLVFYLPWFAAIFTVLNAVVLAIRIRAENRALAASRETAAP